MKIIVRSEMACPPEVAFRKLCDCRNETRWNSQVSKAELVSDEPVRVGTRFRTVNRGKPYSATIATFDDPSALVFDVKGPIDMTASFGLRADGTGTVLEGELDMHPKGFLKLLFPFMKSAVQKDSDNQYRSFARFCETG